jgi:hypothetical protein
LNAGQNATVLTIKTANVASQPIPARHEARNGRPINSRQRRLTTRPVQVEERLLEVGHLDQHALDGMASHDLDERLDRTTPWAAFDRVPANGASALSCGPSARSSVDQSD